MSQPFFTRFEASGSTESLDAFVASITDDWVGMARDGRLLTGYRLVQKKVPEFRRGIDRVTFNFHGDGSTPENYAISSSKRFPDLRVAAMCADASQNEWLAKIVVSYQYGCIYSNIGKGQGRKIGLPIGDDEALMSRLSQLSREFLKNINDDGTLKCIPRPPEFPGQLSFVDGDICREELRRMGVLA